jgi:hypothetical protein
MLVEENSNVLSDLIAFKTRKQLFLENSVSLLERRSSNILNELTKMKEEYMFLFKKCILLFIITKITTFQTKILSIS